VTKPSAPCCSVGERPWCRASRSIRSIGAQSSSGHGRGGVGAAALIFGGAVAEAGRMIGGAKSVKNATTHLTVPTNGSSTTTGPATGPTTPTPQGTLLGSAADVPKGHAAAFTIPSSGDPGIVIHADGAFFAYDAVCPHAGCTVGYYAANDLIVCPCHGSEFAVTTGDVITAGAARSRQAQDR